MKLSTILLGACAMLTATGASAQTAGTYDFSYLYGPTGNTVSGVLTGSLETNNNIFDITGVKSYSVNGIATMDQLEVESTDLSFNTGSAPATASLDGSKLNFTIFNSNFSDEFIVAVNDATSIQFGYNLVGATTNFGGDYNSETYNAANFKASFAPAVTSGAGAVPEPASWAMMILGMGAVGFAMRRRSKVSTTVRFA